MKGACLAINWGISAAEQDKEIQACKDAGVTHIRTNVEWAALETTKATFAQSTLDYYRAPMDKARAAGLKIICAISVAPAWASQSTNRGAPPKNPADITNVCSFLATQWKGLIEGWEIWNEQNISRFWYPTPDPAAYAVMLNAAYPAIKTADPNAKVVFGGLSTNDFNYANNVVAPFDVMATHPYCGNRSPETDTGQGYDFPSYRKLPRNGKPIWFTEMGWSSYSGGVSEAVQADYLTRAMKFVEADPYVEVVCPYMLRDHSGEDSWEGRCGLSRVDFTPKPAYTAYKAYAVPSPPPTPPPPPPTPTFFGPTRMVDKLPGPGAPYEQIGHKNGNTYSWNPVAKAWQRLN